MNASTPSTDTSAASLPLEGSRAAGADRLAGRLVSLDVARGLVILAMLIVNNVGDHTAVGYWWKHLGFKPGPMGRDLAAWWESPAFTTFPLWWHCTLADFVMPWFMLIIGVAMPFSWAAARAKGKTGAWYWAGVIKRGATLVLLGWIVGVSLQFLSWRFSSDANARLVFTLGMDVLQLLGVSYVVARLIYVLPAGPRIAVAFAMFAWHWAFLRFLPQGEVAAGTFTPRDNAVAYAYRNWVVFGGVELASWLKFSIAGMLSAPPAAAMMVLGTWIGETLRDAKLSDGARVKRLVGVGVVTAAGGIAWSFDLPMNKDRWTPCYLLYCAGMGSVLMAFIYWLVDVQRVRGWTWPVVAFGVNAIGVYFGYLMIKIWTLNMPKVVMDDGGVRMFSAHMVKTFQEWTGSAAGGSWLFTAIFAAVIWGLAMVAYSRRWIWKV